MFPIVLSPELLMDFEGVPVAATNGNVMARNPENETKARATLLGALGAYQSSLLFVSLLTKEPEKKAALQFQIRLCQFMLSQLSNEERWKELADVIWGT